MRALAFMIMADKITSFDRLTIRCKVGTLNHDILYSHHTHYNNEQTDQSTTMYVEN